MINLSAKEISAAIGGDHNGTDAGNAISAVAKRVVIDSREAEAGDLFFGLTGENADGGDFAIRVLAEEAWGVVVGHAHFDAAAAAALPGQHVFGVDDPVAALGALGNRWRHELGAKVIGVTGSTGKTSTKDILAALLAKSLTVVATPANYNTEIGLPLTILGAPAGTDVLVLEMAMRGRGQIAELARIADPDVGCIVNVGPVHLEQLGSIEAIAATKAELWAEMRPGGVAILPADEPLLEPHARFDLTNVSFGPGGAVRLLNDDSALQGNTDENLDDPALRISTPDGEVRLTPSFSEEYLLRNLLAAVASAQAIGAPVEGELKVLFSALRGELLEVLGGVTLINDCYNANPVSMRAALDNLARASGRTIAVLGGMGELGADSVRYHHEVARHAQNAGVDLLISVGVLGGAYGDEYVGSIEHVHNPHAAAHVVRQVAEPGDTVLVKGSRSVGLEAVAEVLLNASHPLGSARPGAEAQ
jgi:UDP-N-acetylmuramoyl-tripeptide--D-alanyl-D-alanine ligase